MKKIWGFLIKIAIAVLILSYLIHIHYDSFAQGIRNFNTIYLIPAVAILYFTMFFCAFRWYFLVKCANVELSCREAVSLTMRGYFCSLVLPGGAIGGDVAKIGMIAHSRNKGERFEPGLSILIDRIAGMVALFSVAIILIIADYPTLIKTNFSKIGIPAKYNTYIIIFAILLCLAGLAATAVIFAYRIIEKVQFFKMLIDYADKISRGLISRMKLAIDLYMKSWKTLTLATVSSIFFVHLIHMPILYCICCGLGMEIPSLLTLTTAIILGNIAGLIPLTPGGIGLRDITIFAILQAGDFSNVTLIPLLLSLTLIIGNVSAGIFFFDNSVKKVPSAELKEV